MLWLALLPIAANVALGACQTRDGKSVGLRSDSTAVDELTELRQQIDSLDDQLMVMLAERMRVCREVGRYKKEHGMEALQSSRFNEILEKRTSQGAQTGLSEDFVRNVFEEIHKESLRQQEEILK